MKIVCIGGGPSGLYFGLLMKLQHPEHDITIYERNKAYDTFGWGVVFSDQTLANMQQWDPTTAAIIQESFNHWDDIELHFKDEVIRSGGHGFIGIGRKKLLNILQSRCEALGVKLVFEAEVNSDLDFPDADLIIASDGINSKIRSKYQDIFVPKIVKRPNRFIWLGTNKLYDAFTFLFDKTEHGWFAAHIYQFDDNTSTFIAECTEETWLAHGLDQATPDDSIAFCEKVFQNNLQGAQLMSNARHLRGSAWLNFQHITCQEWSHFNGKSHVVLMGDAVHTAHFAIGSGTKLALEDAIELTRLFNECGHTKEHIPEVLEKYQAARRIDVMRLQSAAWNAMEWFENFDIRYCDQFEPPQLMYSMLTRSQRISHENLRLRDAKWLANYETWLAKKNHVNVSLEKKAPPPMFTPYTVRGVTLKNRVVVSPMAQYSAVDGVVGDYHLVHLGARALGGAGLVMVEMTSPSPDGRITPGCPGLYSEDHVNAFERIVHWIHQETDAKVGLQLGHSGPKGSTCIPWDGEMDAQLAEDNWQIFAPTAVAYSENNQIPIAMSRTDMDRVRDEFVASTVKAATIGFDWLELHCAHGYLLSAFISPLTNQRKDEYGGSLENRLRYPLEIFEHIRAVWPSNLPISVRISAHDWVEGGITPKEAVLIAKAFKQAGADMIDCSSGQVSKSQQPVYGRMYQTPFADRIRQEVGIPTIAVGAISEADHVNSIIAAGRADLCAIARPYLANPAWTLTEAAKIGFKDLPWPKQYISGKQQMESLFEREKMQQLQNSKPLVKLD
jgi:anthraniloyl-CoA monooxygenase